MTVLISRRLAAEKQRAARLLHLDFRALFSQLSGTGYSVGSLDDLAASVKILKNKGLYIKLSTRPGQETYLPSSNLVSLGYVLSKMGLLAEIREVAVFLEKIIATYRGEGKEIPVGELDLAAARKQYDEAISGLALEERGALEAAYIMAAVKDNIRVASHEAIADNYEAMFELLNGVMVNSIEKTVRIIVYTAQRLWPGGNPTLMLYREELGRPVLVPMAVALDERIIQLGQKKLGKKLGGYEIQLTRETDKKDEEGRPILEPLTDSWNPYVRNFLSGEMVVERNLTRKEFQTVCEGFINHRFKGGFLASLFRGISLPQGENSLVYVPLVVADPLTGREKKIGIMAIMKSGFFTQGQLREVSIFAKSAARTLATIEWIDELVRTRAEANAYAEEKAISAGKLAQALEKLKSAQDELVERERLAAAGRMAARLHHQVKNVLVSASLDAAEIRRLSDRRKNLLDIMVHLKAKGMVIDHYLDEFARIDGRVAELVDNVNKKVKQAEGAARGVLSRARKRSGDAIDIPLRKFFGDMVKEYSGRHSFYSQSRLEKSDFVHIAERELADLFRNLLDNAFASVKKRAEEVEGGDGFFKGTVIFTAVCDKAKSVVRFKVADSGTGIEKDVLPDIFDREGESEEGFGFGLPTVKSIVESYGGKISVESSTGGADRGTTFVVEFPLVKIDKKEGAPAAAAAREVTIITRKQAKGIKIMLVEDDESIRVFLTRLLEDMGFEVYSYQSAEDALIFLQSDSFAPDLVISDQNLPNANGHELLADIVDLFDRENRKRPYLAIHSAGVRPASGPVADTLSSLGIAWMEKGMGEKWLDTFRHRVGVLALGGRLPERPEGFQRPAWFMENNVCQFGALLGHKLNNSMTALAPIELYASGREIEDLNLTRTAFRRFQGEIARIQAFVDLSKTPAFESVSWEKTFLPEEIIQDKELKGIWESDYFGLKDRHSLAAVAQIYLDMLADPVREMEELMQKEELDDDEIRRFERTKAGVTELNNCMQYGSDGSGAKSEFAAETTRKVSDIYQALSFHLL